MKKSLLHLTISDCFRGLPLILLLVFITSCRTQEKPTSLVGNTQTPLPNASIAPMDSAAQISEYVVDVFEDSKGNLWFGTMSDGAARFDGKTLTYFSTKDGLCDATVASIVEDHQGNIWFGTHNGASKYDGKTFTNFGRTEGLHGMGCKLLVDKTGKIWAGTNHGAFLYNGISFTTFNIPKPIVQDSSRKWEAGKVWGLLEDKKGNIWFARDAYGACRYDGSTFTHFTKKDGLCSNNVCEIVEDKQGNIWFGCLSTDLPKEIKEGGVTRYDGKTFTKFPEKEGIFKNDIYSMYADKKGDIWMGATGLGVYRYDGKSFQFYKGTDRMDLTWHVGIQSIFEDSKGMLWFGFSGGLFRFNGTGITNVTKGGLFK
jgi:ligand-binding sensor domain-containing protein